MEAMRTMGSYGSSSVAGATGDLTGSKILQPLNLSLSLSLSLNLPIHLFVFLSLSLPLPFSPSFPLALTRTQSLSIYSLSPARSLSSYIYPIYH